MHAGISSAPKTAGMDRANTHARSSHNLGASDHSSTSTIFARIARKEMGAAHGGPFSGTIDTISEIMVFSKVIEN